MNSLLVALLAASVMGGSTGWLVYDRFVLDEDALAGVGAVCSSADDRGPGDGQAILRFRIQNDGPAQDVVLCVLDRDGQVIAFQRAHLPAGSAASFDLRSPLGAVYGEVDFGPDLTGMARQSAQPYLCVERAYDLGFRLLAGGGIEAGLGHEDGRCTSRNASEDATVAIRSAALLPPGWGPAGPAMAAGVAAAALAALVVYQWGRLHFVGLLLFSRVAKHKVLDQDVRQRIHDLVHADPGVHASAIRDRLELAHGQVLYHLHVLVRERALSEARCFHQRHYFPYGRHSPGQMRALAALRQPNLDRVYRVVRERPGQAITDVADLAGMSLSRASRAARRLEGLGLVRRQASGRNVRVVPGPVSAA